MNDILSNNINTLLKNSGTTPSSDMQTLSNGEATATSGDLQQQALINNALIKAGLPQNKINDLIATMRDKLTCNPECQKKRKGDAFKQKWDLAKKNYKKAPEEIQQAEKNYYLYDKGYGAYKEMLYDRYAKTAVEFKTASNKKHAELQAELQELLASYNAGTIYLKRMNELLQIKLAEKEDLEKKIDAYIGYTETNGRKVIYEDRERNTLTLYRQGLLYLFFAIVILYIVFGNFIPEQTYKKWHVWLVLALFIAIPYFLLDRVVKMVFALYHYLSSWKLRKQPF
jgi:hypothetical protein